MTHPLARYALSLVVTVVLLVICYVIWTELPPLLQDRDFRRAFPILAGSLRDHRVGVAIVAIFTVLTIFHLVAQKVSAMRNQ